MELRYGHYSLPFAPVSLRVTWWRPATLECPLSGVVCVVSSVSWVVTGQASSVECLSLSCAPRPHIWCENGLSLISQPSTGWTTHQVEAITQEPTTFPAACSCFPLAQHTPWCMSSSGTQHRIHECGSVIAGLTVCGPAFLTHTHTHTHTRVEGSPLPLWVKDSPLSL